MQLSRKSAEGEGQASCLAGYTRPDLEPLSFDDLPLGGEWTTRRRTVSEAEIALFAGVAGDLSPLTIEAAGDGRRAAPPALIVAMAVGLGSGDMVVRTSGAERHEFRLNNVLFIGRKLQLVEEMQRVRQAREV